MTNGEAVPHGGAERSASEREWLRVNAYLKDNRHGLAVRAADTYPCERRVAGTPLLAVPSWLPDEPVPLDRIKLNFAPPARSSDAPTRDPAPALADPAPALADPAPALADPAPALADVAPAPADVAPRWLPERPDGSRYRAHSDVIAELAAPAVFENRVTYRLTDADLASPEPRLTFTLGRFFDAVNAGGAAAHEFAAAELGLIAGTAETADLPPRAVKDPCDLAACSHAMAVGALTLRYDTTAKTAEFPLHWRDPERVGHAGGMFQIIPVGIFQPSGEAVWNVANDFSLWRCLLREFAEELLGAGEDHGSETAPIDYDGWALAHRMTRALREGRIRAWCLGLGADPLTFALDLLTVVVIDAPLYDELFGAAVTDNAEGTVLPLRPFDTPTVTELLRDHPVQAAGAALLMLALAHADTLLERLFCDGLDEREHGRCRHDAGEAQAGGLEEGRELFAGAFATD